MFDIISVPVLFCTQKEKINSRNELNYCAFIMKRNMCIATDCVRIKLSALWHILYEQ
jgi:hypothetical protein